MPNERGPEATGLLVAYMSSKINGEGRPGRMKNYGMGRQDCAEVDLYTREQGYIGSTQYVWPNDSYVRV
jgi:hypothetical protein